MTSHWGGRGTQILNNTCKQTTQAGKSAQIQTKALHVEVDSRDLALIYM